MSAGDRGFASMDKDKVRAIARLGGASVPPAKRAFSRDSALAAAAGRKGGLAGGRSKAAAGQPKEDQDGR